MKLWLYKKIISLGILTIACAGMSGCGKEQGMSEAEGYAETAFATEGIMDLGNHRVAYLVTAEETTDWLRGYSSEQQHFAIQDLDYGGILYAPAMEGAIWDISVEDSANLRIRYKDDADNTQEVQIPICLAKGEDVVEIEEADRKVITSVSNTGSALPEQIWEDVISLNGEKCEIIFERTSVPYKVFSDLFPFWADYRLTVRDEEKNILQELTLVNYPIAYEEIHWIEDIGGDGCPDIIFCTDCQPSRDTRLCFLIWDKETQRYVCRNLPQKYVGSPIWAKDSDMVLFWEEGSNPWIINRKAYVFNQGEWVLYGELRPENDEEPPAFTDGYQKEIYYKELDYYYRELFYKNGKVTQETVWEESPYTDLNSIWYRDNKENQELYDNTGWGTVEVELSTGEMTFKHIQR